LQGSRYGGTGAAGIVMIRYPVVNIV